MLCALGFAAGFTARVGAQPVVTGVTASQRAGYTGINSVVDIFYTISDTNFSGVNVFVLVSKDSGATWTVPASTFGGDYGPNVSVTPASKNMVWSAGMDWDGHFTTNCRVRVLANDQGLVLIPPGTYLRGNPPALGDTDITDAPQYPVYVSAFYMDSTLVTGGKWNLVVEGYALGNGYDLAAAQQNAVSGPAFKAANHPVQQVTWYDAVKWCNARSEREGLTPCYYTDASQATPYRFGNIDLSISSVKWTANGYRLPTEAEWEKAARGGLSGQRFPWGNNITEGQANYLPGGGATYEQGEGTQTYATGAQPWTSPAGSFPANGYYLYDMAGDVFEWCWDWSSGLYYASGQMDPQGPSSTSVRTLRGGAWNFPANYARCANRYNDAPALTPLQTPGFRCVRGVP